ncbi:MAG: TetR/AcrR family transcriptional regulator [Pseudonocardia sp.]|nr:TetR/AcrR family transcriptional regulator [Pseudonocardia sp.]
MTVGNATSKPRPPRTRRRTSEVRELLLDAATDMFARKGYAATTTDDIAAEAGVARTLIFRHFGSKSDLFRATQLQPFIDLLEGFRGTWNAQRDEVWTEEQLMRTMVAQMYDSFRAHRTGVLGVASAADALAPEATRETYAVLDRVFADVTEIGKLEARRRGWFSEHNLDLTIRMIIGMVASMTVLDPLFVPAGRARPTRDQIIDHLTALALYGIRLAPPPECPSLGTIEDRPPRL